MAHRFKISVVVMVFALVALARADDELPEMVAEKLPVGRLAFVTGRAFGSPGMITVFGGDAVPFQGNEPEFDPLENAIIFSNQGVEKTKIFSINLTDNSKTEIDVDDHDADSPSLSRDGKRLIFVAWPKGRKSSHIYLDNGSKFIPLTSGGGHNWTPRWSPDDKQIVFESTRDGERQIYVMDGNGENQTNLSNDKTMSHAPCWSPDGNHIAYMSFGKSGQCNIFVMKKDGSEKQNISNGPTRDSEPAWSPNGEWIAFTRTTDNKPEISAMNIWIMKRDGTEQQQITLNKRGISSYRPAWGN